MTTGIIQGTGYRARTGSDQFMGVVAPSILPAWMFIGGALPSLYQWNVLGVAGTASDTNVHSCFQRGIFASAPWALPSGFLAQDADVGTCLSPGGRTDSGAHFGSWMPRTVAYSGGALRNANSFYILQGAGHTLGFNNVVIGLGLENDVPKWEPVSPGTSVSRIQGTPVGGNCNGSGGAAYDSTMPRFLDGRNVGGHAGYGNQYLQNVDKFMISRGLGIGGSGPTGGGVIRTFDWASKGTTDNINATGWSTPFSLYPALINGNAGYGGCMCYASRSGVDHIYSFANNARLNVWIYPGSTSDQISSVAFQGTAPSGYVGMCHDPVLDRIVMVDAAAWRWWLWDCVTGAQTTGLVPSPPAGVGVGNSSPNTCLEYDSVGQRYLLNASNTNGTDYASWWSINPSNMSVAALPVTNAPPPAMLQGVASGLKTFNRARYVPNLGIVVCANCNSDALDTQVYWMRVN